MTAIAFYLLKMLVCSGILSGYYFLCLQNKLFHQWNRFYLLLTVIFSVTFPLLYIPIFDFNESSNTVGQMVYKVSTSELLLLKDQTRTLSFFDLIVYGVYCFAVFVFLLLFVFSLYKIYSLKRKSAFIQQSDINIYQTNASQAPFSFFKNIFWKQNIDLQSTEGQQILKHELVHVHEKHSADKVFMQLMLSVFWINPFFWLLKKELTIIHEFIADKKSIGANDASVLASLILTTAYSSGRFDITNQFFHSSIKRRITMITKNKDPRFSYMRRIAALFVLLATLGVLAFRSKNVKEENVVQHLQRDTVPTTDTKSPILKLNGKKILPGGTGSFTITEQKKDGGSEKLVSISTNGNKDEAGRPLSLSKVLYIVDGKELAEKDIETIHPEAIESISVWKDAKAIEQFGDKGRNGVVDIITKKTTNPKTLKGEPLAEPVPDNASQLSQPVPDKVVDTAKQVSITSGDITITADAIIVVSKKDEAPRSVQSNPPLYIVDGKEVTDIKSIDPNTIESINVWKDAKAVQERFGDKGKNGVIDIRTKKTTKPTSLTP